MDIIKLERFGRFVLWIALAVVCAMVPVQLHRKADQQRKTAEAARQAIQEEQEAASVRARGEKAEKFARLSLGSVGTMLTSYDAESLTGTVGFTNASSRHGYACAIGVLTSPSLPEKKEESLASCAEIVPFASNVRLKFSFGGGEMASACRQKGGCRLSVKDVD